MENFIVINTANGSGITEDFLIHREGCADIEKFCRKHRLPKEQVDIYTAEDAGAAERMLLDEDFDGDQTLGEAGFTTRILPCAR